MELNEINRLIDKYFDGDSSREDELVLAKYFSETEELPDELLGVKAMFDSLHTLSQATSKTEVAKPKSAKMQPSIWLARYGKHIGMGVVASVALIITLISIFGANDADVSVEPQMDFICYVDGNAVEDWTVAQAETDRILSSVASNMQQALANINMIQITALKHNN